MSRIQANFKCQLGDFLLDVSLDVPGRGVTAIFGSSGSGKTSLLRCVAGLERARRGYLKVNGHVWQDSELGLFVPVHQRALGYVFQEASLLTHLNVQRNLDYGLRRVPQVERRVPLEQAIELLGIGHLLERQPGTLSGGERQRVAIARALATSPRVLLMDEPLAALDMQRKAEVLPYLERLHEELDIPVLYVSHALEEVTRLADHLVLLESGQVLASGPTHELLTRLDLPLAHGDTAAAIVETVVTRVEPAYHLSHAAFAGGEISLLNASLNVGQRVRVRIQARDVSLTLHRQESTSILNIVATTVTAIASDSPGQVMVCLTGDDIQERQDASQPPVELLARITRKSADALDLQPGSRVYAQVKGVAVLG
ncbi:MAG: molybdenum ABC transporter ATP-binding protein [Polaromonas sp.]|nr:MAG: molybdenum ABC transporter ATP-binding protein [Polaromonas sp.]